MMARYIDADKLKESFSTDTQHLSTFDPDLYDLIVLDIDEAPTADVMEVKHGEWIEEFKDGFWYYDCPFCDDGYVVMEQDENKPNYCHNCGAKMDGVQSK